MILTAERPATNLFGPLLHFDPFVGTIRVSIGPMTDRKTPRGNVRVEAKVRYVVVPQVNSKTVEKASGKSSLTPCILDDDPAQLEMLAALIADLGSEPITTASPEEALKLVQYGRCRLVLADVHMPGMDGMFSWIVRCAPILGSTSLS